MAATYTRRINLYINGLQVQNNVRAIRAEILKLERSIATMNIGSKEYVRTMRQLHMLKPMLDQHNAQLKQTGINLLSMKGIANAFNKYMPMMMGTIGMMAGVGYGAARAAQQFGEFDDKVADVMKVTAMTREQVIALNEELKKIDTRTAQNTLLELAWVAGKLGITAQEDILGFVRAANEITVALAKDLGGNAEEAIRAMGKAVNIFQLEEVYGIEEAMLRVGSAINELGMASVAQEGFLIKFLERVAGVAPLAGVSIENVLGLAATLDMFGQKSEVSATAYSKMMTKMATQTEEMARITGMTIKDWTDLFARDANEAMLTLFESIGGEGTPAFQELVVLLGDAELEGQRMTAVMGALVKNVKTIREQQALANKAFAEGTSVTNEYNIKNNNAQAIIEKKQRALAILRVELGEKLFPVYIKGMNTLASFLGFLGKLTDFFLKHAGTIATVIASLIAYRIALITINAISGIYIGTTTTMRWAVLKLQVAYNKLTGYTVAAAAAQAKLNKLVIANPYVKLAAIIIGAAAALYVYLKTKRQISTIDQAHTNIQSQSVDQYNKLAVTVERLTGIIQNERLSLQQRRDAINELKGIMPEYNAMLTEEGRLIEHNATQINNWLEVQKQKIRAKILEQEVETIMLQRREAEKELERLNERLEEQRAKLSKDQLTSIDLKLQLFGPADTDMRKYDRIANQIQNIKNQILGYDEALDKLGEQRIHEAPKTQMELYLEEIKKIEAELWKINQTGLSLYGDYEPDLDYIQKLRDRLAELYELIKQNEADGGGGGGGARPGADFSDDAEQQALNALAAQRSRERQELNKRLQDGITDTEKLYQDLRWKNEKEYNRSVMQLQYRFAAGRLSQTQKEADSYLKVQTDAVQKGLKLREEEGKRLAELRKEGVKLTPFEEASMDYNQQLIDLGLFFDMERELTADELKTLEQLRKAYYEKIDKLNADHFTDHFKQQTQANEMRITQMQFAHAQELHAAQTLAQAREALRNYISDQEIAQYTEVYEARKRLQKEQEAIIAAEQLRMVEEMLSEIQRLLDSAEFDAFDVDMAEAFLSDQSKDALLSRFKEIMAEFIKLVNAVKDGADDIDIKFQKLRGTNLDIFGFAQDDWMRFFNNLGKIQELNAKIQEQRELGLDVTDLQKLKVGELMDLTLMASMAVANAWSDVNQIIKNIENRRLQEYKKSNEEQMKALDGRLQSGLISEEYYAHEKERLAAELDKKSAEFALKQARRDKAVALFGAIVNTAAAIVKALASLAPPFNLIMAGLIGAAGALQIGVIASTPMPTLPGGESGGQIDVIRSQDGKPFKAKYEPDKRGFVSKPTVITGENGREYIIPAEGVDNPNLQPLIQMIERARIGGNLPTLNPMAYKTTMPGRQSGGMLATSSQPATSTTTITNNYQFDDIKDLIEQNTRTMNALQKQIQKGIIAEVALTGRKGLIESQQEYDRLLSNANL